MLGIVLCVMCFTIISRFILVGLVAISSTLPDNFTALVLLGASLNHVTYKYSCLIEVKI